MFYTALSVELCSNVLHLHSVQSVPEKHAQCLRYHKFVTVSHRNV